MQWQMWTGFGIMVRSWPWPATDFTSANRPSKLGYAASLALFRVSGYLGIVGLKWRLMLASASLPAMFCAVLVWLIPESPRWHMSKCKYVEAYHSMCRLRFEKVQAARDIFYADALLKAENTVARQSHLKELFTVRRNRNAFIGSEIVMFMQQFCGRETYAEGEERKHS